MAGDGRRAVSEFVHVQFADDDRACGLEFGDHRRIFGGNSIFEHCAGRGGANACGVDQIFEPDGNAVQRAAKFPGVLFGVERARLLQCLLFHHCDERVQLWLKCLDAGEACFSELRRRDGFAADAFRSFGDRQRR